MTALAKRAVLPASVAVALLVLLLAAIRAPGAEPPAVEIAYGPDPQQKLDLYRPAKGCPCALVIFVHGGGWWNGNKSDASKRDIERFLSKGIAYATINYRNLNHAARDGLFPPLLGPLRDTRRALQFLRLNAEDLELDSSRMAVYGSSAGGFNALWLALHPDQADPGSDDPVERMSTRIAVAGAADAQTSIDPAQMQAWVGSGLKYGGHAFGLPESEFDTFLERRKEYERYFYDLSPAALARMDAPPVILIYTSWKQVSERGHMDHVHSPAFGSGFMTVAAEQGQDAALILPGGPGGEHWRQFLDSISAKLGRTPPE
jgi:acetyl esterase/lipase